jgi:hypothetical protein
VRVAKHGAHGIVLHALGAALARLLDGMTPRRTRLAATSPLQSRLDVVVVAGMRRRCGCGRVGRRISRRRRGFVFAPVRVVILGPVDWALLDSAADFTLGAAALSARIQRPTSSVLFIFYFK